MLGFLPLYSSYGVFESEDAQEGGELCYTYKLKQLKIESLDSLYWFGKTLAYVQYTNSSLASTKNRFWRWVTCDPLQCKTLSHTLPYYL